MDDYSTILWLLATQEIGSNGTGDDMDTSVHNKRCKKNKNDRYTELK